MTWKRKFCAVSWVLSLWIGTVAIAEEKAPEGAKGKKEPSKNEPVEEKSVVTRHRGTFGGEEFEYRATAGTIRLASDEVGAEASIFYVSYTREKEENEDDPTRPLVFCFNGGPGSSSVWLHYGGLGPKRVDLTDEGKLPPPPFQLEDNAASILDIADLVFVDPVSTGYSRAAERGEAKKFHGFEGDLKSLGEAVRLYVHRHGRWLSPKFLCGESYGALRVCGLAETLQDRYGMYLNGLILVSGVLDFETIFGGDVSAICFLPVFAEVAAYHGRLDEELVEDMEAFREEVESFARGAYAAALVQGAQLGEGERGEIRDRLARYTGLEAALIERENLRISPSLFRQKLLEDEGKIVGRFDARITAPARNRVGDPSYDAVYGPFSAAAKHHISRELNFESESVYEVLTRKVQPWNYDTFTGETVKSTPDLASAMGRNPYLQVLVNCGRHDLATPGFAIQHSLDHLEVDPALQENIRYTYYTGGHMMYTIDESNRAWNDDIRAFIEANRGNQR